MRALNQILLAGALAFTLCATPYARESNGWLLGKWEMTFDPDGSEKDWLVFSSDGTATSIGPVVGRVPCTYTVSEEAIALSCTYKGTVIPLTLNIAPDHKKLLAKSKKTGNSSEYQRASDGG